MIDTIKLELPQSMYSIFDHSLFTPSTYEMFSCGAFSRGSLTSAIQNPTAKDKKAGIYKPRLTVRRRHQKHLGYQNTLYVETSLPKLVYGNNFDELENKDYDLVRQKLADVLKTQGVGLLDRRFTQAKISLIHYGKNIVLDDYSTPYTYIKQLKKIDISKVQDVNQTDYRNGGLSYKMRGNLFEFTFYDKLKDLERSKLSEKRAIDKDTYCQLSLLDQIKKVEAINNPFQVLRIEMRLNNRTKIKQTLRKHGLDEIVSFEYLFDQKIAKTLLLDHYKQMLKNYIPIINNKDNDKIFFHLKANNPKLRDGKLLELSSAQSLINKNGVREFRNMVSNKTWYRLKKDLQKIDTMKPANPLNKLKLELEKFEAVKLVDYPQLMLNNDKNEIN